MYKDHAYTNIVNTEQLLILYFKNDISSELQVEQSMGQGYMCNFPLRNMISVAVVEKNIRFIWAKRKLMWNFLCLIQDHFFSTDLGLRLLKQDWLQIKSEYWDISREVDLSARLKKEITDQGLLFYTKWPVVHLIYHGTRATFNWQGADMFPDWIRCIIIIAVNLLFLAQHPWAT